MNKKLIFLLVIAGIFVIIQFIPANKPVYIENNPHDLIKTNGDKIPKEIKTILKTSCYDCHSNEPSFPWYSHIAPVKWLVYKDINNGREELNFSHWNKTEIFELAGILDEMNSEVQSGEMPMEIYTKIHQDAKLSNDDKKMFEEWTLEYMEALFE